MLVGVPKEVKTQEYRVGLVPGSVRELVHHGHSVLVEAGAGLGAGFGDEAYAIPCRRFAGILANACARLGADVVCYSFIAVDFHHLLLAGLPAHSLHGLLGGFRPGNASKCWGSRETLLRIHATSR